ncbi:hypothetical protein SLS58_007111 [Diplodia intermedia]|uniref:Cytochrome c domain-containing protein n=1 Tax=Diplodia intermedia TaxID=856260 RepID=A0ABR3TL77_9PEZI
MFHSSSNYSPPTNWSGPLFKIRNDYPAPLEAAANKSIGRVPGLPDPSIPPPVSDPMLDAPWTLVDYKKDPLGFCARVKEYCFEGNVNNNFNVHENKRRDIDQYYQVRDWYHAPWMNYGKSGREPISGLTFERPTPSLELSDNQHRVLQTWAIGFFNSVLMTDAKDDEVSSMKGSPAFTAVTAQSPENPQLRNDHASEVRLLQIDFAVQDDGAPIGWVFGTFMYDGRRSDKNPWDRIVPVGLQWGNDPDLTQKRYEDGQTPQESWINPEATKLRASLHGKRPFWGWNGRMNGPADNFVSACASCHSLAEKQKVAGGVKSSKLVQDMDNLEDNGFGRPKDDEKTMKWFRNIRAGETFDDRDAFYSGDYSLQLMIGYMNMQDWLRDQKVQNMGTIAKAAHFVKLRVPFTKVAREKAEIEAKTGALRTGPELDYSKKPDA